MLTSDSFGRVSMLVRAGLYVLQPSGDKETEFGAPDSMAVGPPVQIAIGFAIAGGTYTARLCGQSLTGTGAVLVHVHPGTHEIAGVFRSSFFGVSITGAGLERGSLLSLAGPAPQVTACGVTYDNLKSPAAAQEFRIQFRTHCAL